MEWESFESIWAIQGDPLSFCLFLLNLERLLHLINVAIDNNIWDPIQISRNGPKLAYLAFADDIILFAKGEMSQVEPILKILELFYSSLGQKVSREKTRVFFS